MKHFLLLLSVLLIISSVSAAGNVTNNFTSTDVARITHSYQLDPGTSAPWEMFILSGLLGLVLLVYTLVRPKAGKLDYEIDIIISVLSWPCIGYFAWSALRTGVDRVVGTAATSTDGISIVVTQHILYLFPLEGWIAVAGEVLAIFVTILLIGQYKMFKEQSAETKT